MSVLVVGALLLAAWVLTAAGRAVSAAPAAGPGERRRRWRRRAPARGRKPEVTRVLVEVATRLRAGASLAEAWRRSLPDPLPVWAAEVVRAAGVPSPEAAVASAPPRWHPPWRREPSPGAAAAAAAAACRLAARTGAPLAEVIDVVVTGIGEAAEGDELRRTALAGPRATARLLAWLPAGGIALGTALGADPLAVLLGGGLGGVCLVTGGALFLIGRRWVQALVSEAERAGR